MIFLMDFDSKRRCLHGMKVYPDHERPRAQDERLELGLAHLQEGGAREVVLLAAADEAILRRSHARYFEAQVKRGGLPA
ncbi:hypothetical protein ACG02S_20760 [Roseateles sp. DC23W]|uniref:Uncharacterized protein n=1 Tax=Pelomonas dachongensis TaxID=3299029 RepID=A0ABW7ESC4_9BURK